MALERNYVVDCIIHSRPQDTPLIGYDEEGVFIRLNGYVIIPKEEYDELQKKAQCICNEDYRGMI